MISAKRWDARTARTVILEIRASDAVTICRRMGASQTAGVGMTVTPMVYEIIGKVALYIIGTLLFGAFSSAIDDDIEDSCGIFFGAWIAGIIVFLELIIPAP